MMKPFALAIVAFALTACGSDVAAPVSLVGVWRLSTVDGKSLPVNLAPQVGGHCGLDVQSGEYDLKDGGDYTGKESYGTLSNGVLYCAASQVESGTYAMSGSTITLRDGLVTRTLTISHDALLRMTDGHKYVYRK